MDHCRRNKMCYVWLIMLLCTLHNGFDELVDGLVQLDFSYLIQLDLDILYTWISTGLEK